MKVYYNTCTYLCDNQMCDKLDGFMCPWIFEHIALENCSRYSPVRGLKSIEFTN